MRTSLGKEIRFGGEQAEFLAIYVYARTFPDHCDHWDGNWLNARVDVAAGGFTGRATGNLRAEDFVRLLPGLEQLYTRLDSRATFTTMEEWLEFALGGNGRGAIEMNFSLMDAVGTGNKLRAVLHLDQTYLKPAILALREVVELFPVRGQSSGL